MVRFLLPIKPKDGGRHFTLSATLDLPLIPMVGDPVVIDTDYGVSFEVHNVTFAPTCDPAVYVNCRSWFAPTERDALEVVEVAKRHGWVVIG